MLVYWQGSIVALDPAEASSGVFLTPGEARRIVREQACTPWLRDGLAVRDGSVRDGARRELVEETGMVGAEIGRAVWYGEQTLRVRGEWVRFRETFVLACTTEVALSRERWEPHEHASLLALRWWTASELRATGERILPSLLRSRAEALHVLAREPNEQGVVERVDLR
ncbi:MAG: NUDIX domain-containing protein [Polyangiales bacterium]